MESIDPTVNNIALTMSVGSIGPTVFNIMPPMDSIHSINPPITYDSSNPSTEPYNFCKTSPPINERVQDLISRLTLDEKISQLINTTPPIPRLGIPSYKWWSETLHGVRGGPT